MAPHYHPFGAAGSGDVMNVMLDQLPLTVSRLRMFAAQQVVHSGLITAFLSFSFFFFFFIAVAKNDSLESSESELNRKTTTNEL